MATAPSPNDLTRQQLDELDALLQRMLSVPLAPADTPMPAALNRTDAPPLPPSWRIDPPAPAPAASVPHLLLADPLDEPEPLPKPELAKPPAASRPQAPLPNPKPPTVSEPTKPQAALTPKPKVAAPEPAKPQAPTVPSAPPVPLPLLPLVALNSAFDAACGLFGPPGKLLRSGFFKQLYGLTGLALLAYTAAHVAQVQGWISLPVVLPWPRAL